MTGASSLERALVANITLAALIVPKGVTTCVTLPCRIAITGVWLYIVTLSGRLFARPTIRLAGLTRIELGV
ncbi:hypothetical protein D3C75_1336500 [compost metagenome]